MASDAAAKVARNLNAGRATPIKGAGALRGDKLAIKPGLDLLKPIAKQVLLQQRVGWASAHT